MSPLDEAIAEDGEEAEKVATVTREYLCIELREDRYAFPIECVVEVAKPEPPTAVPQLPPHILGVVRRGRGIVAVLDIGVLCAKDRESDPSRTIVLAVGELEAAVPVTRVTGILNVDLEAITRDISGLGVVDAFADGQFVEAESVYCIVDVEKLLRHASPRSKEST